MPPPSSKALAPVRQKIVAAIRGTRKKYPALQLGHAWGLLSPSSWNPTWKPEFERAFICPMACVILHYDQVDDVSANRSAAGKILKVPSSYIQAFIRGFDSVGEEPDKCDIVDSNSRRQELLTEWWYLGKSFRRY